MRVAGLEELLKKAAEKNSMLVQNGLPDKPNSYSFF